jgi:hypothetical protein
MTGRVAARFDHDGGGGGGSVSALFGYVPALGPEVPTLADNDASSHQPNHVAQESARCSGEWTLGKIPRCCILERFEKSEGIPD